MTSMVDSFYSKADAPRESADRVDFYQSSAEVVSKMEFN